MVKSSGEQPRQVAVVPILSAQSLLERRTDELQLEPGRAPPIPCFSVTPGRGRQPPEYGLGAGCTTCRRPPRYRDGVLVDCVCGARPNRRAAPFIVRYVEDAP